MLVCGYELLIGRCDCARDTSRMLGVWYYVLLRTGGTALGLAGTIIDRERLLVRLSAVGLDYAPSI